MTQPACLTALTILCSLTVPALPRAAGGAAGDLLPIVRTNDNRTPAGTFSAGALVLNLRASLGLWRPEGDQGPALAIQSFGESSGALQIPAPLIRVPEGTEIVATIRNDLDALLQVHGLCSRDGSRCAPIDIPPSSQRDVRFTAGQAGTYHYWATTSGLPQGFRAVGDTQLSGAFVVDPPGARADADRILVITEWTNLTVTQLRELERADDVGAAFFAMNPRFTFLLNGLSWPATERFTYRQDEPIRWRVINLSTQAHPMHLHGFYYEVETLGDGLKDRAIDADARQRVVTQLMPPGSTMLMTWRGERPGNWLFHCHISEHIAPERQLAESPQAHGDHHGGHSVSGGMAAMVLGVTILDAAPQEVPAPAPPAVPRRIALVMQTEAGGNGTEPAYGFVLADGDDTLPAGRVTVPGPTLALRRGEPVEITLLNHLPEATAIHWHGMELDSYYDGVHGWSGAGTQVTPLIEPGQAFTVRFTPPRTGTFIYHTHLHDDRQLTSGMYGAMLVLDPGERFDPALDHVMVIGRAGLGRQALAVLNGQREPLFVWKAGARHRLRFVNITPGDILVASLGTVDEPVRWMPITKDGAPVPPSRTAPQAAVQTIAVGETYDFEFDAPAGRKQLWLNLRTPGGRWQVQGRVVIR